MIYQIKDWDEHFENNRSRQVDKCNFICIPNKQSGMGLTRILAEKDGLAIYGAWHLITGACSQQHPPRRGWLTDTGRPGGLAWTEEDLAIKFRRDAAEFKRALDVLTGLKVDWIIAHKEAPKEDETAPLRQTRAGGDIKRNGHRQRWQVENDIQSVKKRIVEIRKEFGQEQIDGNRWVPALNDEQKARVNHEKEKIKILQAELDSVPVGRPA